MDWKTMGKRLLFPPVWVLLLLTACSTAALLSIFLGGWEESPAAYAVYVISFYTLTVVCLFLWMVLPERYRKVRQKIDTNPLGRRYLSDPAFRTHISLRASLAVNLMYAGINGISYVLYDSMWFVVLAGYYLILSTMRFLLVRYVHKTGIGKMRLGELKIAVFCSAILLTVNFVLSGAVMMILYQNRGFEYHGILIYVMAMYTFYITTHAVIDVIRYRKYDSPVMTITKIIALSAALVSMLSLETAMLSQFGQDMAPEHRWWIVALTGAGVSITVVGLASHMIVRANNEIRKINEETRKPL